MTDAARQNDVVALITPERLGSYVASMGDMNGAIRLYEWNLAASGSAMELAALVEIIVRNALDRELQGWAGRKHPGDTWFDRVPLDGRGRSDLTKARARATQNGRRAEVHGRVLAELSLGFWRYLVESRYLTSLWIPATHAAFPNGPNDLRQRQREVKNRLQQIHFLRNRAAHHEPIHSRDLDHDLSCALELLGWISVEVSAWAERIVSLPDTIKLRP